MNDDLAEAKPRLPLPTLLHQLGLGDHAKKTAPCPIPGHDDQHNSFSAFCNERGLWFWKCFAGCGEGDEITFLEKYFNISNAEAIARYKKMVFGVARPPLRPGAAAPLNWDACNAAFTTKYQERLADWRKYSGGFVSWLQKSGLIGLFEGRVAFPVYDETGKKVVGVHYRLQDTTWRYFPEKVRNKQLPLVIGELATGDNIHCFESQWDACSFMDLSGEYTGIIITRGSSNGRLVAGLLSPGATLYAWTQNDKPGEKWAKAICANRKGTVKQPTIPTQFKDLNDWVKGGATTDDLFAAMLDAQIIGIDEAKEPIKEKIEVIAEPEPEEEEEEEPEERPPAFPIECLPLILRRVAEEISKLVGVPLSMAASMVLAVVSMALGKGLRVRGPRYLTTGNLYMIVSKVSGSGGSQAFDHVVKPIVGLQQTLRHEYVEQVEPRIKTELKDVEIQIRNLETDLKKATDPGEREKIKSKLTKLNAKQTRLEKYRSEVLFVTDTTPEAAVDLMVNDRENTTAQLESDASGALAIIKGERYTQKGEINAGVSIWLKGYSCEPISLGRKSGGGKPQHVEEPCMACLFVATPGDVEAFFRDPRLTSCGLLPRFLVVDPKARPVSMDVNNGDAQKTGKLPSDVYEPYKAAMYAVTNRYRLFKKKWFEEESDDDAQKTEPEPFEIGMTSGARKLVIEDHNRFCAMCEDGQDRPYESRHTENAIRIALDLHAFHCIRRVVMSDGTIRYEAYAHEHPIDEATMRDALRIRDFFNWHQERFRIPQQTAVVDAAWAKIQVMCRERSAARGITVRDLRRKVGGTNQEAEQILAQLEREGRIRKILRESTQKGGRPTVAYQLASMSRHL